MSTTLTPAMKRSALISMLRDPKLWPKDFQWNFDSCRTCAVGLWFQTIGTPLDLENSAYQTADNLGITPADACAVFGRHGYRYYENLQIPVTPAMVADKLEALHKSMANVS